MTGSPPVAQGLHRPLGLADGVTTIRSPAADWTVGPADETIL